MRFFKKNISKKNIPEYSLNDIYDLYKKESLFGESIVFTSILDGKQRFKEELIQQLLYATTTKDQELLDFCITAAFWDGIDNGYIDLFYSVILEKWHTKHEDIVDIVYHFKNDKFTNALIEIANNPMVYRLFDDENESTLRKCFHALKVIDSENAKLAVADLINSRNPNILAILDMYK